MNEVCPELAEVINAHLDVNPFDWEARAVLADLYEDLGREAEARFQRWLVEHEKCPLKPKMGDFCGDPDRWFWWAVTGWKEAEPSTIGRIWDRLSPSLRYYGNPSRTRAEKGLRVLLECFFYRLPHPLFRLEDKP